MWFLHRAPASLLLHLSSYSLPFLFTESEVTRFPEISVSDFLRHNRDLHANSDDGFSMQFEEVGSLTTTDLPAENSYLPENRAKNRYVNISACKLNLCTI